MGALDIAPTLYLVEPDLNIQGEEWMKVMDEPVCPIALRSWLLDNAPSHACRLAFEHNKTVLHGTVKFQPPCSPDLSP